MEFSNAKIDNYGGVIQTMEFAPFTLTAASVSQIIFACPIGQTYKILEVRSIFSTASSSGTAKIEYLTGTTAPGSGTAQTAAIALSGTANTLVVSAPTVQTTMKAGDRLNCIIAGTMTGLAGGFVQVTLVRLT